MIISMHVRRSAALLAVALAAASATAADLKMLMSWDDSYSAVTNIPYPYVKNVAAASGGKITIKTVGPETVPPFEQLQPVSAGVFDLLFSHGGYHTGATGIGGALDAVVADPDKRRASGVWDAVDKYYQDKHNLKLISVPTAPTGFHFLLRKPLDPDGMWKGRKIRGTQVYHGIIRALGGSPVVVAPGEVYSSLEKGVLDGVGFAAVGTIGFKIQEVAPIIMRPTFGTVSYMIFANKNTFNKLPADEQKILLDEGVKLERATITRFQQMLGEEDAEMVKKGAQIVQYPKTTQAELNKLYAEEAWKLSFKGASAKDGERLYELAKSKGVTY